MKKMIKSMFVVLTAIIGVLCFVFSSGMNVEAALLATDSSTTNINPNGNGDYAKINGKYYELNEFVKEWGSYERCNGVRTSELNKFSWQITDHDSHSIKADFSMESPIVNWVNPEYLNKLGVHFVVGKEYAYIIRTEKASCFFRDGVICGGTNSTKDFYLNEIILIDITTNLEREIMEDHSFYLSYEFKVIDILYTITLNTSEYEDLVYLDKNTSKLQWYICGPCIYGSQYSARYLYLNYYKNCLQERFGDYITLPTIVSDNEIVDSNKIVRSNSNLFLGNITFATELSSTRDESQYCFTNKGTPVSCDLSDGLEYVIYDSDSNWTWNLSKTLIGVGTAAAGGIVTGNIVGAATRAFTAIGSSFKYDAKGKIKKDEDGKKLYGTFDKKGVAQQVCPYFLSCGETPNAENINSIYTMTNDLPGFSTWGSYNSGSNFTECISLGKEPKSNFTLLLNKVGDSLTLKYHCLDDNMEFNPFIKTAFIATCGMIRDDKVTLFSSSTCETSNRYRDKNWEYNLDANGNFIGYRCVDENWFISTSIDTRLYLNRLHKQIIVDANGNSMYYEDVKKNRYYRVSLEGNNKLKISLKEVNAKTGC